MSVKVENHSYQDFKALLQEELVRRHKKNDKYSIRSYARDLDVNHATLSSILSGKRPLTHKSVLKLGKALRLPNIKINKFVEKTSTAIQCGEISHKKLSLDVFTSVSEWQHDAILELTHVKGFSAEIKWVSSILGLKQYIVKDAVERLMRLGLLKEEEGQWIDVSRNNTTNISNDLTSSALREHQKSILELSMAALRDCPRIERDHTSTVFAMQKKDLNIVKEKIKNFRLDLINFIERSEAEPDEVYQLAISIFPLTKKEGHK